jgi:hypothetical protein
MGNKLTKVQRAEQAERKIAGVLHVPLDCKTLKTALKRAMKDRRYHTIFVGKGEHQVKASADRTKWLHIDFPITIVGKGEKNEVVVVGGFKIEEGVQGNVHLQNMTIRHLNDTGVDGKSPFTLEDVIVEQCGQHGVFAKGTACVARCTNVEVRQCNMSGMVASSGAITLMGAKTTVHHNCIYGYSGASGLHVSNADSKIQLVHPLTKESVATDNQGGGNWDADYGANIKQILTIPAE